MDDSTDNASSEAAAARDGNPRYRAFLSYSHRDRRWARWLMRRLETYRTPGRLAGRDGRFGPVPRRLGPLFRDREELASASDLTSEIKAALNDAAALIVIASPAAAQSRWVNEEVLAFKRLGHDGRIFTFVVDGDPGATEGETACFPPALRYRLGADGQPDEMLVEPVAADARPEGDGRKRALGKLVAGLLGVPYDALRQREVQRRNRRLMAVTAASLVGMFVTVGLAISAYLAREDAERRRAQAEDLLGFMVGDLRESLEPLGRLDLLDRVGDKAMAYFSAARPSDLNDDTLSKQARALTQIGEVRLSQARYQEAVTSFERAYARSVELLERHPDDGARLFDRGQAEFWIGYVAWERGDTERAREWFVRYLETSADLAASDPDNDDWGMELVYAQHNLAVLDLEYGDVVEAAAIFEDQIEQLRRLDCPEPRCEHIRVELADATTWQGLTALARGRLEEARGYFAAARERVVALLETSPEDRSLEYELADETGNVAITDWWLGRLDDAHAGFEQSLGILRTLTRHDPENLDWGYLEASISLNLAESWLARGQPARAQPLMTAATDILDSILAEAPSSRDALLGRARSHLLTAQLLGARSEPARAREEVERASRQLQEALEQGARGPRVVGRQATSLVLLGETYAATGASAAANDHWRSAIELLAPYLERSLHPRLAEPFVRAHLLSGQDEALTMPHIRATGLATPGLWQESEEQP